MEERKFTPLEVRFGDILAIREGDAVVCQQVNCVACKPHSLSERFVEAYGSRADVYGRRTPMKKKGCLATIQTRSIPGEVIYEPQLNNNTPAIAHLVGQYMFGRCGNQPYRTNDTGENDEHRELKLRDSSATRKKNFKTCLTNLAERVGDDPSVRTIYFPYKIGCGEAGGNWTEYKPMIEEFAANIKKKVVILNPWKYN